MSFAERSKYLRKEKGLSQVELAKALNISKACISMIEIGKNEPTAITLIKYADFFQCSIDYLLERANETTDFFESFSINQKSPAPALTQAEQDLLDDFRSVPRPEQAQIAEYAHYVADKHAVHKLQANKKQA